MGCGISPHSLLNMGTWVTHNLNRLGSLHLSQPHTTSPIHMGSEISFHPHSLLNGFRNLPHPLHIFLESPILKPHQINICLDIMPRLTYIITEKYTYTQKYIIDNIYFFVNSNSTSPMQQITTFFSGSHMLINVSYSRKKELYILPRNFQYNEFY